MENLHVCKKIAGVKVSIKSVFQTFTQVLILAKNFFIRIHPHKIKFAGVFTATLVQMRLNAQKVTFSGVYLRFSKSLSAWAIHKGVIVSYDIVQLWISKPALIIVSAMMFYWLLLVEYFRYKSSNFSSLFRIRKKITTDFEATVFPLR